MILEVAYSRRQLLANADIAASRVGSYPCVGLRSSWCPKSHLANATAVINPISVGWHLELRDNLVTLSAVADGPQWPLRNIRHEQPIGGGHRVLGDSNSATIAAGQLGAALV
jgi:hypothetical protein